MAAVGSGRSSDFLLMYPAAYAYKSYPCTERLKFAAGYLLVEAKVTFSYTFSRSRAAQSDSLVCDSTPQSRR